MLENKSYRCSNGVLEMKNLTSYMWVVVLKDINENIVYSESFPFSDATEKQSRLACRRRYAYFKQKLVQKPLEALLDD